MQGVLILLTLAPLCCNSIQLAHSPQFIPQVIDTNQHHQDHYHPDQMGIVTTIQSTHSINSCGVHSFEYHHTLLADPMAPRWTCIVKYLDISRNFAGKQFPDVTPQPDLTLHRESLLQRPASPSHFQCHQIKLTAHRCTLYGLHLADFILRIFTDFVCVQCIDYWSFISCFFSFKM